MRVQKFSDSWSTLITGKDDEGKISGISNIKRGRQFEKKAISYFQRISKSSAEPCGFFIHPSNKLFGASPDAIGPAGFILEVKTRAENKKEPIQSMDAFPHYFLQCQLQMDCTNSKFCVLLSYHPESDTGKFFLIIRNNLLLDILKEICEIIKTM